MKRSFLFGTIIMAAIAAKSQTHPWLHISSGERNYTSVKLNEIERITHENAEDGDEDIDMMSILMKDGRHLSINLEENAQVKVGTNVATLYIDLIDNPEYTEIQSKEYYEKAIIRIDGNGVVDDLEATPVNIKGRGNSTWEFAKKPYRLKFDDKTGPCGMKAAKNFALIANYIDDSHLHNAVAFKIAELLEMPFTNSWIPVRIVFNGIPKGAYFITEKIGINSSSVDIDGTHGILFEIDSHFDEEYKFKTDNYDLPVMVKDPDLNELAEKTGTSAEEMLGKWESVFNQIVTHIASGGTASDVVDTESLINYALVYTLTRNEEILQPKSTYAYMENEIDLLHFGPVWDFDWAYDFSDTPGCFAEPSGVLTKVESELPGNVFFHKIFAGGDFLERFTERWNYFYEKKFPELLEFIDEQANIIGPVSKEDGQLWPDNGYARSSFEHDKIVERLKTWLIARAKYINEHPTRALYE